MKLSVVIPVYCVEQTLERCLQSICAQTIADMEIILVDDGSTDSCPTLCDQWADKDRRIRVIHKANGGLSDARNAGIDVAKGDLITFVDSDDYLADNTYSPLLSLMDDCDILEFSIANKLALHDRIYSNTGEYWLKERVYLHTYAWNKIYKRHLFNHIRFPKGKIFEDAYTLPKLLQKANKIRTTSRGFYHYSWNPNGISATADATKLAQLLEASLNCQMPMDDNYYMYVANLQTYVTEMTGAPILLPERHVDLSNLNGKLKIKAFLLNTLGIKTLCRTNKIIHLFKKPSRL